MHRVTWRVWTRIIVIIKKPSCASFSWISILNYFISFSWTLGTFTSCLYCFGEVVSNVFYCFVMRVSSCGKGIDIIRIFIWLFSFIPTSWWKRQEKNFTQLGIWRSIRSFIYFLFFYLFLALSCSFSISGLVIDYIEFPLLIPSTNYRNLRWSCACFSIFEVWYSNSLYFCQSKIL